MSGLIQTLMFLLDIKFHFHIKFHQLWFSNVSSDREQRISSYD